MDPHSSLFGTAHRTPSFNDLKITNRPNAQLAEELHSGMNSQARAIGHLLDENTVLKEEIRELKAEIERLKKVGNSE